MTPVFRGQLALANVVFGGPPGCIRSLEIVVLDEHGDETMRVRQSYEDTPDDQLPEFAAFEQLIADINSGRRKWSLGKLT